MIQTCDVERTLAAALARGGDFAELFAEDTLSNSISMLDGKIENAVTGRIHGAGIRVYCGFNSVYVHTCQTDGSSLLHAAAQAADAAAMLMKDKSVGSTTGRDIVIQDTAFAPRMHPVRIRPEDVDGKQRRDYLAAADAAARKSGSEITQVSCSIRDVDQKVYIYNSDGLSASDHRTRVRMGVSAVASANGENQMGFEGPGILGGFEMFDTVDPAAVGAEAARTALTMLHAEQCPAGEMPVVIGPAFGGVIFHEACGHSLEATSVAFGNSEMCNKLGQKIASDVVTAIDDGTIQGKWGSISIDDEGIPTNKLILIENGILKNYMVDRLNGRRMGMAPTGSARRQSYTYEPTSRMRNTYIAAGETSEAEMIATMGDGLYCSKMGGGSVNPVTGEFNFSVAEGYLVRDGKLDRPVRGATLIGRGSQILQRIDRVGPNLELAEGMCGSSSGAIPVCVGQPSIRVSCLTVGGRE